MSKNIIEKGLAFGRDWSGTVADSGRPWCSLNEADVAHELHVLDFPDMICKQSFTSYLVPPGPGEGFNIVVHTP